MTATSSRSCAILLLSVLTSSALAYENGPIEARVIDAVSNYREFERWSDDLLRKELSG